MVDALPRVSLTCGSALALLVMAMVAPTARAQDTTVTTRGDSVSIRLVDVDVRAAVQALSPYLDRPVAFGAVNATRVTLETPRPVPRRQVADMLRGLLASQSLELIADSAAGLYRVQAKPPAAPAIPATSAPATGNSAQGPPQLFVIRLSHARAADVAATVNALFGRASALGEPGGGRPATLPEQLQQNVVPPAAPALPGAVASVVGRAAVFTSDVAIVPDASTNSLLIRASRADFELIAAAVKELDVRPLEVLIEVLIAEVRRDRSLNFGVAATLPPSRVRGSRNTQVDGSQAGPGLGDFALHVMGLGGSDIEATLSAAAARGDATIVSRPVVIAANNDEAQILVGSQRPFVQVSRSLPTDTPTRDQVVEYKDVGTQLTVRPTISSDGYVMLQVTQEVNAATAETQFDAPIISTRTVETELLIRDGQTVVLGGLTDQERDRSQSGIPFLSALPWIGGFFGQASRSSTETELFLFLTPHVIRDDAAADSLTKPYQQRAKQAKP